MFAITASRPCRTPAFSTRRRSSSSTSDSHRFGQGCPVAVREIRPRSLECPACRTFQPWRRPTELVEPRERGVDVRFVEHLAATDQIALDSQNRLSRHSASKPSREVPFATWVMTAPISQPMHGLDVDAHIRSEVPHVASMYAVISPGSNASPRRWSMFTQSGVGREFVPVPCGVGLTRLPTR